MRQRIGSHLTFANVVSVIALFVALGGTATAVTYVVSSNSQIGPGTIAGHNPPTGDHANIIGGSVNQNDLATASVIGGKLAPNAVNASKVLDNSLTGADIADRSGVDTCQAPLTGKFGPICVGSDGGSRPWLGTVYYCTDLGLRLPSISEARALAVNYDVPGVATGNYFWTDVASGGNAIAVSEEGGVQTFDDNTSSQGTVCVTDPSA